MKAQIIKHAVLTNAKYMAHAWYQKNDNGTYTVTYSIAWRKEVSTSGCIDTCQESVKNEMCADILLNGFVELLKEQYRVNIFSKNF